MIVSAGFSEILVSICCSTQHCIPEGFSLNIHCCEGSDRIWASVIIMPDPGTLLHVSCIPVMWAHLRSLFGVTCAVCCSQHIARSYQGTAAPKLCAAGTMQKYGCHPWPPTRQRLFSSNYTECRYLGLATVCACKERLKLSLSLLSHNDLNMSVRDMHSIWIFTFT
jgi:hypothetical protein